MKPTVGAALAAIVMLASGCAATRFAPIHLSTEPGLTGWKQPTGTWRSVGGVSLDPANPKAFAVIPGAGVLLNSPDGHTSDFFTTREFGDCELHVEFTVPKDSNSGVYFCGRYEVQILDSFGKSDLKYGDCGGLYASCSGAPECYAGKAPPMNASRAPGEWQEFDVVFRAPRFDATGHKTENARFVKVVHNGRVLHENQDVTCPTCSAAFDDERATGPLKLQGDHGPVAFRNLRIRPLALP